MATKETYKGVCEFCHAEIDKSKMTQHLKSCKQRKAELAVEAADNDSEQEKTKFFHLVVEGKYLPMYWMHLEVPATDTLDDLDTFLRDTWLECCGHLSAFEIAGVSYMSQTDDDAFFNVGDIDDDDEEEDEGEDESDEDEEVDEVEGGSVQLDTHGERPILRLVEDLAVDEDEDEDSDVADELDEDEDEGDEEDDFDLGELENMPPMEMAQKLSELLASEFGINVAEITTEEFKEKLLQLFQTQLDAETGTQVELPAELREQVEAMAPLLHTLLMFPPLMSMLDEDEDDEQDMDVELDEVLEVGQKFSYEYDFGSTTELSLRVVGEREGYLPENEDEEDEDEEAEDEDEEDEEDEDEEEEEYEDTIRVLAQNLPPVIPCRECGKPATHIVGGFFDASEGALCDACASKLDEDDQEMLLPLVNSPRTGVCAYVG
jgi:hypothetical protein